MKRILFWAAALMAAAPGIVVAADPSTQPANSADEIRLLRQRIAQLEVRQRQALQEQHDAQQAAEQRATADELSRAAVRSEQFLTAEGFTAGYTDNRFVIQDANGRFLFHPFIDMQFREVTNVRQDAKGTKANPEDEVNTGFEVRRLRFGFDGQMFTPDLTYYMVWQTQRANSSATVKSSSGATVGTVSNNLGGVPQLQEAWVKYRLPETPFFIRAGQIKDPLYHEQIVSSRYQQAAERSLSADIFANGDAYTEAVTFIYDPATFLRAEGGVTHGMRSADTNFLDYPNNGSFNSFNYGAAGRVEYKAMGRWRDYDQVGAVNTKQPLLVFATGADYSERGHAGQIVAVADAMYGDPNGLSLYGAFLDRYTTHNFGVYTQGLVGASIGTPDPAVANRATNEYGVVAQAGYIIARHWEPFGRYEYIHVEGTPAGSRNYFQSVAGGLNYYFYGHRLKLTGEMLYLPQGLPFDDTSNDVLMSPGGKGEYSFIAQVQLLI